MKTSFIVIGLVLLIVGCFEGDFYSYSSREDLLRVPLIWPYELTNTSRSDSEIISRVWHLELTELNPNGSHKFLNISEINVSNGIIFGHGNVSPTGYVGIIADSRTEYVFKEKSEWLKFLSQKGIDGTHTLDVWNVFSQFNTDYKLPWKIGDEK